MDLRKTPTWLLVGLKMSKIIAVIKTVKVLKIVLSLGSILLSMLAYGLTLGPWFGIGLVLMLFIHEMGHVIALRMKHMPASLPVFIPFLGAAIFTPSMGDRDTEAYIGIGGPILGTIGALLCFGLWAATGGHSDLLLLISYIGIYINLFNLIPISPLDGGRITQAVGAGFKLLGLVLAIALVVHSQQPGMILVLILILDSFSNMPLWLRPATAIGLLLCMIALFTLGSNDGLFWLNVFDIIIGACLCSLYALIDQRRWKHNLTVPNDDRPGLPLLTRLRWLTLYFGLAIILGVTIVVQTAYLPSPG